MPEGNTTARGYGTQHQLLRAEWAPLVATGRVNCWRCGQPIPPGTPWDLGHDDHDRSQYRGPEHPTCNRSTTKTRQTRIDIEPRGSSATSWDSE